MFGSLFKLVGSVADIVLTPVVVVVDLGAKAAEPLAEVVKDLADDIKSIGD